MKKNITYSIAALALTSSAAFAGGIDRSGQSVAIIFETGTLAELSFGHVNPTVSGVSAVALGPLPAGSPSGDMAPSYSLVSLSYKQKINDNLDFALIMDQPFGAAADYPAPNLYFNQGSVANLDTTAITGILKYRTASNISVFAGLRYQTLSGTGALPPVGVYAFSGARDSATGYVLGVAWEKPEYAMRVALTYSSKINHALSTVESFGGGAPILSTTNVSTPQSVNLEFQSGVAPNTLVFGSIRWVDWSAFDISPVAYVGATGDPLVSYANNTFSYKIGVGRKINDQFSIAATLGYEPSQGGFASNLGPTDGNISLGIGGSYTMDNIKLTGGVTYIAIGDANTTLNALPPGTTAASFTGNHAIAAGIKITISF